MIAKIHYIMVHITDFISDHNTLKNMGYDLRPYQDLVIAKTTNDVKIHSVAEGRLDLKGMIYTMDGVLIAPGCKVPLDVPSIEHPVDFYSKGRDGVQYRFYYHNSIWKTSTTGRIRPNAWGPKGTPTFEALLEEVSDQWNEELLNKKYCYYAILESPNFTNLVKHKDLVLTLIDIIDCSSTSLTHIGLECDKGFIHHESKITDLSLLDQDDSDSDTGLRPLTANDVGYVIHYENGDIYKNETLLYSRANTIKPNRADPAEHWVNLYKNGPDSVTDYLCIFPWYKSLFNDLYVKFALLYDKIVDNYRAIVQSGTFMNVPARNVQYMRELLKLEKPLTDEQIHSHILAEDAARIFYMLNPYNVPPKSRKTTNY